MASVINLLDHQGSMLEELLAGKTPTYPDANAVEIIKVVREQITESNNSAAHNLLTKTKQLIGNQKIAINAHSELTSFVLAEQMSNNLATEVASLNTTITESVDTLRTELFHTVTENGEEVEYIGGPNTLFTGIFKGCVDGTLHGSVTVLGEGSECTLEGEATGNTFVVNPALANPGQLDNVAIGAHVPLAGTFTALSANSLSVAGVDVTTKFSEIDTSLADKATTAYVVNQINDQTAKLAAKTVVDAEIDAETLTAENLTDNGNGNFTFEVASHEALKTAFNVNDIVSVNQKTLLVHSFINDNQSLNNVYLLTESGGVVTATIQEEWDGNPSGEGKSGTSLYVILTQEIYVVTEETPYKFSTIKSSSDGLLQTQIDTNIGDITTLKSAVNAILNLMGEQSLDTNNNVVVGEVHPLV